MISSEPDVIFKEFLESEHGQFLKKYVTNNDPLPSYKSPIRLKTPVPASSKGDRPSLLLYNLPGDNVNHPITQVSAIQSAMRKAKDNLLVLLGTSGCGKTRTCYELLCESWGLYFVGARKGNGGSGDIEAIESYLWENKMITDDFGNNRLNANHVVRCLVLSRLLILNECIKSSTFNPQRWLFLQTCQNIFGALYDYSDDLFRALAFMLTSCTYSSLVKHIDTIYKNKISGPNIFPIIFDEAQSLQRVLDKRFRSRFDQSEERSLLSPIVQTLKNPTLSFTNHCVIPCGTGLTLLSLDEVLASTGIAKQDPNIDKFTDFGRWEDIHHVKDYCSGVIDLTEENYKNIYKHFRGRFRPIVTCLEEIIMGKEIDDAISKLWSTLTKPEPVNNRPNQQSLYSQLNDIRKMKRTGHVDSENVLELYKHIIITYEYSGGPVLFTNIKQMTIVETGFGCLREINPPSASELKKLCKNVGLNENISYSSSVNEDLFLPAHVGEKALVAFVDEPFAIAAGRNYFNDNGLPEDILRIMSDVNDAGACGTLWQKYLPEEFERIFNGENNVRDMTMFAEASESEDLPAFCIGSPKVVKSSNVNVPRVATTAGYSLDEFFNESSEDSHPAFFIPDDRCGPDIIFFVKFEEVAVPVFVQVKLRFSVHAIAGALSTIDPRLFYQDKNGKIFNEQSNTPIIKKIKERCERYGSIGLLVSYPANVNLESFVTNNHPYNTRNQPESKQLIGIIDQDNASKIFQKDHLLFIDTLKNGIKRKWVNEEEEESSVSSKKQKC